MPRTNEDYDPLQELYEDLIESIRDRRPAVKTPARDHSTKIKESDAPDLWDPEQV